MVTILLLTISTVFMTFAWYEHLRHKDASMWKLILVSWLIAFLEYCFQVPANLIGSNAGMRGAQLKVTQEVITLEVFSIFAVTYLGETLRWNHLAAFVLILGAVALVNMQ